MSYEPKPTDAQLRLFWDHKEISDRLGTWCRCVDTRNLDPMAEVFDAAVVWDFGKGTVDHGLERIIQRIKAHMFGAAFCGARQIHIANLRVEVEGDDAQSEAYFFAASAGVREYTGRTLLEWGNYHDIWARRANGWRIVKRNYRMDIQEGPLEILYGTAPADMWEAGDARRLDHT